MKNKKLKPRKKAWKMGKWITSMEYQNKSIIAFENREPIQIKICEIAMIKGNGSYSIIYLINNVEIKTSKKLSYFCKLLPAGCFGRYSKSFIINLNKTLDFTIGSNWGAIMVIKKYAEISREYRVVFLKDFGRKGKKRFKR